MTKGFYSPLNSPYRASHWLGIGVIFMTFLVTLTHSMPRDRYMEARANLLKKDRSTGLGRKLVLNGNEEIVSKYLINEKREMIQQSRLGKKEYFPSVSFYRSKPLIEKTMTFHLIEKMPKGAALHLHDMAITSLDWLVQNVTYRDHLYMCHNKKLSLMVFKFAKSTPPKDNDCSWISVKKARKYAGNIKEFDMSIKKNLSLLTTDPFVSYPTLTDVWTRFQLYFAQVFGMIFYAPVFKDYFHQALKEFQDDNVQYLEIRSMLLGVYDLDGKIYSAEEALQMNRKTTIDFMKKNKKFSGAKIIRSSMRMADPPIIKNHIKETIGMMKKYPGFMLGYDLVGQEDVSNTLIEYRDDLLYPGQMSPPFKMPYYFHTAETNWQDTPTDDNLIDAVLLNTTRIGHGYGLIKHPALAKEIKERDIAIEVNPISNQLLGLVKDMRNHALVPLMADDYPVVVSSDDPIIWEASPLSHDFYVAFMNMCGEDDGLTFLKQLAINSIQYSSMTKEEKKKAMSLWENAWKEFINDAVRSINPNTETALNRGNVAFGMFFRGVRSLFGQLKDTLSLICLMLLPQL